MNDELIAAVKLEMGYSDGTDCCRACRYFKSVDQSGARDAKPAHCNRNAFWFPVSEAGRCNSWEG